MYSVHGYMHVYLYMCTELSYKSDLYIVLTLQLTNEESARNEVEAKLMSTSDTLKELQTTYETEKAQKDAEIAQLRDEVRNVHDYMYLCIYVYMYMYMYTCKYNYVYMYMYTFMYMYMYM